MTQPNDPTAAPTQPAAPPPGMSPGSRTAPTGAPRVETPPSGVDIGRKVSDGLSVRVFVPEGEACAWGELGYFDNFLGMHLTSVGEEPDNRAEGTGPRWIILQIEQGEYELAVHQVGAADFDRGDPVYYNPATNTVSATGGAGAIYAGKVTVEKDASGTIWFHLAAQQPPAAG